MKVFALIMKHPQRDLLERVSCSRSPSPLWFKLSGNKSKKWSGKTSASELALRGNKTKVSIATKFWRRIVFQATHKETGKALSTHTKRLRRSPLAHTPAGKEFSLGACERLSASEIATELWISTPGEQEKTKKHVRAIEREARRVNEVAN